jgi:hypothetical protein
MRRRTGSRKAASLLTASALSVGFGAPLCSAQVTLNTHSNSTTDWTITNGGSGADALTIQFDPTNNSGDITNISLNGSPSLLNGGGTGGSLDAEMAGTPFSFANGPASSQLGPNNSYVDVWTTVNSTNSTVNPFTYQFHYVVFANDPSILVYETVTAPSSESGGTESLGQGQFLFRSNPALFPSLYQANTGPNNLDGVTTPNVPSTYSNFSGFTSGSRSVSNVTYDLTNSGIAGDNGTNFFTKYDYSTYTQFYQAETMFGPNYAVSEVIPNMETLTGGPTKQELAWTDPGILNLEFLSDHYGIDGNGGIGNSTTQAYPGYAWYPTAGGESRLFGAYSFYIQPTVQNGTTLTGAQLNQNALNDVPNYLSEEGTDNELVSSGFVPMTTSSRGAVQINAASTVGWSANTANNTAVLSEPHVNMQESTQGDQYWGQISQNGTVEINNVVPGTYRLTLYQLGQWGETRIDGVTVSAGQINTPNNVTFTAENFNSTATPVWTIGTPNRSDNEFLDGNNTSVTFVNGNAVAAGTINPNAPATNDERQFDGAYNYWAQVQSLNNGGTQGGITYNATNTTLSSVAVAATNNPLDWPDIEWGEFNPGLYDPSSPNGLDDGYTNTNGYTPPIGTEPAYVRSAGGAATYRGSAWTVNFAVTSTQASQGSFIDLSVALGDLDASLVVTLNGHSETWSYNNFSPDDPQARSGDAGFYQWAVFEFPTSDLNGFNSPAEFTDNNQFTFGVSNHAYGVMWDALRMEIDATGASPAVTGWQDYTFISGSSSTAPIDYNGQTASNALVQIPEPTGLIVAAAAMAALVRPRRRRHAPTS